MLGIFLGLDGKADFGMEQLDKNVSSVLFSSILNFRLVFSKDFALLGLVYDPFLVLNETSR